MGAKKYFKGRSGLIFWLNVLGGLVVLFGVPYLLMTSLDAFTHHGEKIEVPDVVNQSAANAAEMLDQCKLVAVVSDSTYDSHYAPGTVLAQHPLPGNEVKSGREIYLTVNRNGYPPIKMPDLVRNTTERIASMRLKQLGFKLTTTRRVENEPEGLVLYVKQGSRTLHAGEMISRDVPLTIYVGDGFPVDTLEVDSFGIVDDGGFDIEL